MSVRHNRDVAMQSRIWSGIPEAATPMQNTSANLASMQNLGAGHQIDREE